MKIKKLNGEYAGSNTYLLTNTKTNEAVLFDAGANVTDIIKALDGAELKGIYLTHGHFDHISNLQNILNAFSYSIPIYLHSLCHDKLFDANKNLSVMFGLNFCLNKDMSYDFIFLSDNDKIAILNHTFNVYNFLGHSDCSLAFLGNNLFIVGDVLFENGVGRYDLEPNGLNDTIITLKRIKKINGYELVLSGHGDISDRERQQRNIDLHIKYFNR